MRTLTRRSYPWTGLDPERRNAILLVGGIGIVVALALAIVAYGYYSSRVSTNQDVVLTVGSRKFDYAFYQRRAHAEYVLGTLDPNNVAQSVANLLTQIEKEEVTRQAAKQQGVSASNDEVEARMKARLSLPPDVSRDVYAATLHNQLLLTGLSLAEFRDIALAETLDGKLTDQLKAAAPAQTDYVDMSAIKVFDQSDADAAKKRLDAGEDFGAVAASLSKDGSAIAGGVLGSVPRGSFPAALDDFVLHNTGRSDIIAAPDAFYIVNVNSVTPNKDVDDAGRSAIATFQFSELLRTTADGLHSVYAVTGTQIRLIVASLGLAA